MLTRSVLFIPVIALGSTFPLSAQLNVLSQFDPSNTSGTCGIAYNSTAGEVLVIGCFGVTIDRYTESGTFLSAAPIAGESANDVDVDMSPVSFIMNGTAVDQGQLLLMNGETDEADIYAIDEVTMAVIDTLEADFGVSHVVGGSYHPARGTFFLVQDQVPGGVLGNRIAEVDASTGDTLQTFSTIPAFQIDYGDLDISPVSGNLFVVSSIEPGIAEFTPDGLFVTEHALPVGVSDLSGIALDNDLQGAWVCNTGGTVFKLGNFPVAIGEELDHDPNGVLFPNPTTDLIELDITLESVVMCRIVLRDVAGRVIRPLFHDTLPAGDRRMVFDLDDLAPGSYSLYLEVGGRRWSHGLVVAP